MPSPFSAEAATKPRPAPPSYRAAKALPFELEEQCRIYLEEQLFIQALQLLSTFLVSGLNSPTLSHCPPAYIPPASHIALISTLAIHPSYSTRTSNTEKHEASSLALQYLNLLTRTIGPINSGFIKAYTFPSVNHISRRGIATRRRDASPEKRSGESEEGIMSDLAGPTSLWVNAGDFWSTVGWAFTCSVLHKKRWERWRLWLEHVLDLLEKDCEVRQLTEDAEETLDEGLLARWTAGGDVRRMMRAIFADGVKEGAEFGEIWRNETKQRKEKEASLRKEKVTVDVENGDFGDYFNDSEDDEDFEEAPTDSEMTNGHANGVDTVVDTLPRTTTTFPSGSLPLGGSEALSLRLRLLSLLCQFSLSHSELLTEVYTLYEYILTHARPHPLLTFVAIISPPALAPFPLHIASTLIQYIAYSLRENGPKPKDDTLTQSSLEKLLLPFAANTNSVADNAKFAACVECLVRLFDDVEQLKWGSRFQKAVEDGITKREEKGTRLSRKKGEAGSGSKDVDLQWLKMSGKRLRIVARLAKERGK